MGGEVHRTLQGRHSKKIDDDAITAELTRAQLAEVEVHVGRMAQHYRQPAELLRRALGAELAVASWTGLVWAAGDGTNARADVGSEIEVRATWEDDPGLAIYDDEPNRRFRPFVLAIWQREGTYVLAGWLHGYKARTLGLRTPPGQRLGWRVPVGRLQEMASLPRDR